MKGTFLDVSGRQIGFMAGLIMDSHGSGLDKDSVTFVGQSWSFSEGH